MRNYSEFSMILVKLRPGYVPGVVHYFFENDSRHVSDEEMRSIDLLRGRAIRHGFNLQAHDAPAAQLRGAVVSRLFNAGSLLRESYAYIVPESAGGSIRRSFERLFDALLDFERWESDNIDATDYDFGPDFDICAPRPKPRACAANKSASRGRPHGIFGTIAERIFATPAAELPPPTPDEIAEAENEELCQHAEAEQRRLLQRIGLMVTEYVRRYHRMPDLSSLMDEAQIKGKFIVAAERFSPVVVNGNMEIVLPYYDEMKLRLTPLCKAIYILFLKHPEGIVLKNIGDFENELRDIYLLVKPGADDGLAQASVSDICSPCSESLQQKISMIKRNIGRQLINPLQRDHYTISGERGMAYRLAAAGEVVLPAALS